MINILYIILAFIGLGFLVLIHELGHYIMAKRAGMKIETFSIGFGKPIFSWMRGKVKWQIGFLPFGGYVKIAGMQGENGKDAHEIKNGFYGKKPIQRIKVAIMGPLVNLVFALFAFTVIWMSGGRDKAFQEVTHRIGYIDKESSLYDYGIRPGDEIIEYDGRKYSTYKDLLMSSVIDHDKTQIKGYKINYLKDQKTPFDYTLNNYQDPEHRKEGFSTIGILAPASYSIYSQIIQDQPYSSLPMQNSGIEYGDRIVWVDGELIFSNSQLNSILNEDVLFLTINRNGKIFHSKMSVYSVNEFNLSKYEKEEIDDWRHEGKLDKKTKDLKIIPYYFNEDGVVQRKLNFIEEDNKDILRRNSYDFQLMKGDKIIAIANQGVSSATDLLKEFQTRKSVMIVQRDPRITNTISWKDADVEFDQYLNMQNLHKLIGSIGLNQNNENGNLHLLNTVEPKPLNELTEFKEIFFAEGIRQQQAKIAKMKNPEEKQIAMDNLIKGESRRCLGIILLDKRVKYNPNPFKLFSDVCQEIGRTLLALVTGYLSPKHMAGPVGIMQIVHQSWSLGFLEALFWLGVISLNLGVINLLPLPVFDGGHILFSGIEMVTKKPIKSKTMEKLIIPFVILIIGAFIFMTFNDLTRLFSRFF